MKLNLFSNVSFLIRKNKSISTLFPSLLCFCYKQGPGAYEVQDKYLHIFFLYLYFILFYILYIQNISKFYMKSIYTQINYQILNFNTNYDVAMLFFD